MKWMHWTCSAAVGVALLGLTLVSAAAPETPFADAVGAVAVGDPPKADGVLQVPFIFWGGDVATFLANGAPAETKPDSIFGKLGLKLKLTKGDDFLGQVKDYLAGKTPFLRGTMSQIGQASEVLGKDPRTQPVVFLQLTWSKGDHLVAREGIKTLNDLKGKKIALQRYGPHVGMLNDVLHSANLKWDDITVVWTPDVTGKDGPAEKLRSDKTVDACFVVTPDMMDLTGGLKQTGNGADKTIKGAHVVVSTQDLNHSIADVYACRKDFFDKNKDLVQKFTAGYLKACEDLVDLKNNHDAKDRDKDKEARYLALLKTAQDVWGKDALPGTDDVHGLISDATLVCLPGNYLFFTDKNDVIGFQGMAKAALDMAVNVGSVKNRSELLDAGFDYDAIKKLGDLKLDTVTKKVNPEPIIDPKATFDVDDTIFSFTVQFDANGDKVDKKKYEEQFQKSVEEASKYGHAVLDIRGHVDPLLTVRQYVKAALDQKSLQRTKEGDEYKYFLDGKPFDLNNTKEVLKGIAKLNVANLGADDNPQATVEAAKALSDARAKNFREAIVEYAKAKGLRLEESQFKSEGVGIAEPLIGVPRSEDDQAKNRRVEFRIIKVPVEAVKVKDYNDI